MTDELLHDGEYAPVQRRRRKHRLVISERVLQRFGEIAARKVGHDRLFSSALKLFGKRKRRLPCVAVHSGVGDEGTLALRAVAAPCVVKSEIAGQIPCEHGPVERTDRPDFELREFFQERLHLRAVFSHYVEVVSARLARPVVRFVGEGAEFAERVRRKQHFLLLFVSYRHFRPMHHGRGNESKFVFAQSERIALFYDQLVRKVAAVEVAEHLEHFCVAHHRHGRILRRKCRDARGMIRLHVRNDQIVRLSAAERDVHVAEPLRYPRPVHGVHDRDLVIEYDVRIVRHSFGHFVLPFEKVEFRVVNSDINDVFKIFHSISP